MEKNLLIKCDDYRSQLCFLVLFPITFVALSGCQSMSNSVIAATGTTVGVEVSQNQATQTPMGVFGYRRAELAYVPTNKVSEMKTTIEGGRKEVESHSTNNGARDAANVIMELKHQGIFDWSSDSGIYQRLAVGDIAVAQPGAQAMFLKNNQGQVDKDAADALQAARQAVRGIPEAKLDLTQRRIDLGAFYDQCKKNNTVAANLLNNTVKSKGYSDFPEFAAIVNNEPGIIEIENLKKSLACD